MTSEGDVQGEVAHLEYWNGGLLEEWGENGIASILYATDVLAHFKHPDSESALLALRHHPAMHGDSRAHLAFALFDLFSAHAFDWGYELIGDPDAEQLDSVREAMFAAAVVNGVRLSDMDQWAQEFKPLPRWDEPLVIDDAEPEQGDTLPIDIEDIDPPPQPAHAREPVTIRNTSDKVGRNDPCSCGSGKKYKKCCQ